MSLSFDDMMKKFYDDPKLGIQTEDAPTTSTANVVGTGDDSSTVIVKRKKKPYDGRTKEARAFMKRIENSRAKRESKLAKKVQENTLNFENEYLLVEDNIDVLKNIVKNKQHKTIKFKDGSLKVDMFTASAITKVFDLINKSNQEKMKRMVNGSKGRFMKIADFALSKVK